ncbi:DNA repair protein RadC [Candidatus Bipolaricaulota bacterium]|nr:DNA repair protein RadC [Candidatus Bipolaricaulota bacterium]
MKYRIEDLPEEDRPRERLKQHGPEHLSDSELLALVIRSGIKGKNVLAVSREILNDFELDSLSNSTLRELQDYRGVGEVKAGQILAVFELGKRFAREEITQGEKIFGLDDVIAHLTPELKRLEREELRTLHLNNANELICEETVFRGSLNEVQIEPREIAKNCLKNNTSGVILAHNHPGGGPDPSEADITVTERIETSLDTLGITLVDHVIVGRYDEVSLKREGYL